MKRSDMKRVVLMAGLFMALACSAGAGQTNSLDALKQGFQAQEKALLDGYGKSLVVLMADFKKKGELDSYLATEAESKRFSEEKDALSLAKATNVVKDAVVAYHKGRAEVLKRRVAALDGLMKAETKAGNIEVAKAAKDEKGACEFELAAVESKLPKEPVEPTAEEVKKAKIVKLLLGKWDVTNAKKTWRGTLTFKDDGTVVAVDASNGTTGQAQWTIEEKCILIKWSGNDNRWDSFYLPLSKSVRGDSWAGKDWTRATKME